MSFLQKVPSVQMPYLQMLLLCQGQGRALAGPDPLLAVVWPTVVVEPVMLWPRPRHSLLSLPFADDGWRPLWKSPERIQRDLCNGL